MKRFVLIAGVVGALLLGIHLWNTPEAPTTPGTPAAETTEPVQRVRTVSTPHHTAATPDVGKGWEKTVEGFANAYPATKGLTRQQWLAKLRPYLAKDVLDVLDDTDLDQVPAGHYVGHQVLRADDDVVTVRVTYREGWALILYLGSTGHGRASIASFDLVIDDDQ